MTALTFSILLAVIGLLLIFVYSSPKRERVGMIVFGVALFFVFWYCGHPAVTHFVF